MARIRSLKPEFWEDEALARCTREARLVFMGLISHSDDEGRQRGGAALVRANVFPYDEDIGPNQVGEWLDELERERLVVLYETGGQRYVAIRNWCKHQKVDHLKPSTLPAPPDESPANDDNPEVNAKNRVLNALEGKGGEGDKEGIKDESGDSSASAPAPISETMRSAIELCNLLADEIAKNDVPRPNPLTQRWLDAARLMIDRDGLDPEEIRRAIVWVQRHEFWRANILSMPKLREKWATIKLQAQRERGRRASASDAMADAEAMLEVN